MIHVRPPDDLLRDLSEIEREFFDKFDREMTPREKKLYRLTKDMFDTPGFVEQRSIHLAVDNERRESKKLA